jgi:hypothetical protein
VVRQPLSRADLHSQNDDMAARIMDADREMEEGRQPDYAP